MPSLLIIASNFPPIQSAGVYRTLRIAKYLPECGWSLDVLTLRADTLLKGTSTDLALLDQVPADIQVYRAPARFPIERFNQITGRNKNGSRKKAVSTNGSPEPSKGTKEKKSSGELLQRLKDRLTLPWMTPDRMVGWVTPASKMGIVAVRENKADVIYSSGPPWSNHLVAGRIVNATGLPWVADFRDPWVGNAFRPGRSEDTWAGRKHRMFEAEVYQNANVIIFNTDRARDNAVGRIGTSLADKSVVIPNGFDPAHFDDSLHGDSDFGDPVPSCASPLHLIHTGAFYGKRNVDSLLATIGELKRNGQISAGDLQLEMIGGIRTHEQNQISQYSIDDIVTLAQPVPHHECLQRMGAADALLLVQTGAPLCIPGKLYEYIAVGKPILTLAAEGATADLVSTENLGPCLDPADGSRLKAGLLDLIRQHRNGELKRPDESIRDRYDGRQQMTLFDSVLRQAISAGSESSLSAGVPTK